MSRAVGFIAPNLTVTSCWTTANAHGQAVDVSTDMQNTVLGSLVKIEGCQWPVACRVVDA